MLVNHVTCLMAGAPDSCPTVPVKLSDVDDIHKAGLITEDQRRAIVAHFELDRESNKLLAILSIIGAVLVSAGIILLIASNWDAIPRLVKLAGGLALLGGAHAGGWLSGARGRHPRVAEALHLIGSVMFLANIALVGQIYHLTPAHPTRSCSGSWASRRLRGSFARRRSTS